MQLQLLNQTQIKTLLDSIQFEHLFFTAQYVGYDVLSEQDRAILEQFGINESNIKTTSYAEIAFKFGMLTQAAGDKAKTIKWKDFKKFVKSPKFPPLSEVEQYALANVKSQLYSDIKGLGNRIVGDFSQTLIEADKQQRAQYERIIKKETTQAVVNRETVKQLVSRLGHSTQDWARDFGRIADYTLHNAFDHGRSAAIKKQDPEALVYKDVFSGACKHCVNLYLTQGEGSKPKTFKISDIEANGSNIGRKVDSWLPVIGPTHPFCRCTLNEVPNGMVWSDEDKAFSKVAERKRKIKRNSKVSLQIGDKMYKI